MENNTKEDVVLNEKLQVIVDNLGSNPNDEPEIAKALDAIPLKKSVVLLAALKGKYTLKDFKAIELAECLNAIREKVMSFKDADGNYKATPLTNDFNLPNFEEIEELENLVILIENNKFRQKTYQDNLKAGGKIKKSEMNSIISEFNDIMMKIDELTWRVAGITKEKLSPWEQQLVAEQIFTSYIQVQKTSVGKH